MRILTARDYTLPTTARTAHLPNWMASGWYADGKAAAPACSFAGHQWSPEDGGAGLPLCRWCLLILRRRIGYLVDILRSADQ